MVIDLLAFTLSYSVLCYHEEISLRPFRFVNSTLFIVLINELLIKTRAGLSRLSCGLTHCSHSAKALLGLLSGQTFSHM